MGFKPTRLRFKLLMAYVLCILYKQLSESHVKATTAKHGLNYSKIFMKLLN